jgi:hypothetical protein
VSTSDRLSARAYAGFTEALEGHPWATVDGLMDEVTAGNAFVWHGERADVFVRLEWPALEVGPICGSVAEVIGKFRPWLEGWAVESGFREIHVQAGRSGWSRTLRKHGYEEAAVILRKVIHGSIQ